MGWKMIPPGACCGRFLLANMGVFSFFFFNQGPCGCLVRGVWCFGLSIANKKAVTAPYCVPPLCMVDDFGLGVIEVPGMSRMTFEYSLSTSLVQWRRMQMIGGKKY